MNILLGVFLVALGLDLAIGYFSKRKGNNGPTADVKKLPLNKRSYQPQKKAA